MTVNYTEDSYENSIIELFENMGYQHIYEHNIEKSEIKPDILIFLKDIPIVLS